MASKVKATGKDEKKEETPEKEVSDTPDTPLPLLDLSDAAVKKLIRGAKKRGYVTVDQINSVLPSEEVNSEQIEDVLAMFSEMGVNVVETEEAEPDEEAAREEQEEEPEADSSSELVEAQRAVPAKSEAKEPAERTDDPVRMYLREMGSVELLSREGEIAIAKRIEAGREAMIAGLCESPLTFQAIIIWRDELNEGKVFLRDIIDLEATYAGPDAKAIPAPLGPDGRPMMPGIQIPVEPPQTAAPATAPLGATPFQPADVPANEIDPADSVDPADSSDSVEAADPPDSADLESPADSEDQQKTENAPESDFDDDMENSLSLAARLTGVVVECRA